MGGLDELGGFEDDLRGHLRSLEGQLTAELADLLSRPLLPGTRRLVFDLTFDTMGGPITATADGETRDRGWPELDDTFTLLHPKRLYPEELLDDPYWDDPFIRRAMKVIAGWFHPIWLRAVPQGFPLPASLLSYSYDEAEQFNLQSGQWEPCP